MGKMIGESIKRVEDHRFITGAMPKISDISKGVSDFVTRIRWRWHFEERNDELKLHVVSSC